MQKSFSVHRKIHEYFSLILIVVICIYFDTEAQNFWEEAGGPQGGWVRCLTTDKDSVIYAGFNAGQFGGYPSGKGLYKSDNDGSYWESIPLNSNQDIQSIVIDSLGRIFLYARGGGVYRSTDSGHSWVSLNSLGLIEGVQLDLFSNNTLVAGSISGLYFSTDGGDHWSQNSMAGNFRYLFIDNSDNLYVSFNDVGFYKTTDYGESWTHIPGLDVITAMCQYQNRILFAGTYYGIYVSEDGGNSWAAIPGSPALASITTMSTGGFHRILAGTNNGVFVSIDDGQSWKETNTGLMCSNITSSTSTASGQLIVGTEGDGLYMLKDQRWESINSGVKSVNISAFIKNNNCLLAGSREGIIYRSEDSGNTWEKADSIYSTRQINAFAFTGQNSFFFSSQQGIFKSTDTGKSWFRVSDINSTSLTVSADTINNIEYIFSSSRLDGIYRSSDDGLNWYSLNNGLSSDSAEILVTNSSGMIFAATSKKIYRTSDFGSNWENIYQGSYSVIHISLEVSANDYLYAGLDWGNLVMTTDNGDNWIYRGQNLPANRITSVTCDSLNRVYVGNWEGKIYQSIDYGEHWKDVSSGMIGGPVLNLYCDGHGKIYVGPYGGSVYRGVNSSFVPPQVTLSYPSPGAQNIPLTPALVWQTSPTADSYRVQVSLSRDFDSSSIVFDRIVSDTTCITDSLELNTRYYWRVSCSNQYGWSIWSISLWFNTHKPTSVEGEVNEAFNYSLSQNYPNPFNPTTVIKYEIRNEGVVQLKVYDILGKEVETLVNEHQNAGSHSIEFNGKSLSSGVYLYQLKAGSFSKTRKLLLIK